MFVSDRLIYLELHKTGCSHIRKVLMETVGGELDGKHNRPQRIPEGRYVLGSVRNPWAWYVSLWAYGSLGKGLLRGRLTQRFDRAYYQLAAREGGRAWPVALATSFAHDLVKPVPTWRETYSDSEDPVKFRRWLKMVLDPRHRHDLGDVYAFSPVSRHAGFLTFRYLKLYTRDVRMLYTDEHLASADGIREFDSKHGVLSGVVRTEHLAGDLLACLLEAGYELDEAARAALMARATHKTNASSHRATRDYYDDETLELVAQKESFIVEKHMYAPPVSHA